MWATLLSHPCSCCVLRVCVPEQVLTHCKMARFICILLACFALLCCAPLTQAATKAAKSKDVTKLQIGVKVRGAHCAISQLHILPGLIWALSGLGAGMNAQQSEGYTSMRGITGLICVFMVCSAQAGGVRGEGQGGRYCCSALHGADVGRLWLVVSLSEAEDVDSGNSW